MIQGRDSKGHFTKGNVPWNKRTRKEITFTCKFCGKQKPIEEMKVAMRRFPLPFVPVCRDCWKLLE